MKLRLPLILYGVVYLFTFVLGAAFLLSGWGSFVALEQLFTGAKPFWLSPEQLFVNLLLVLVAPVLFVLGYELGIYRRASARTTPEPLQTSPLVVILPWVLASVCAVISLARGGGFQNVGAWLDYRKWVFARWQLFDTLSFFEFANIYNVLPVATVLLLLWLSRRSVSGTRKTVLGILVALPVLMVDVLIFQKKTLLIAVILFALAWLLDRERVARPGSGQLIRRLAFMAAGTYVLYCALVIRPALSAHAEGMAGQAASITAGKQQKAVSEPRFDIATGPTGNPLPPEGPRNRVLRQATGEPRFDIATGPTGNPLPPEGPRNRILRQTTEKALPGRWIGIDPESGGALPQLSRGPALFFYALLGPFTRTPLPALAYPAVYPTEIPFYGLDMGLDMFGMGYMPRDNIYIHRRLWPQIRGGTVMVPFQFALYSQVGVGGALALSFLIGYLLAISWITLRALSAPREVQAVASSLLMILAIYLAGDSIRNSLLASYGVFWGFLGLALWLPFLKRRQGVGGSANAVSDAPVSG